ncbi:MAG: hypothetical protein P1V51_19410 [Deltaproteobacteria bacterium]|nr:hypothetical protein [Deltaproteobacteria bacterium]
MRPLIPLLLACAALAASGCGSREEPVYDDDIGVQAIPVEEPGGLAGRFALAIRVADLVDAPLIGESEGGSMAAYLVERAWDGETYSEVHRHCTGVIEPVAGNKTFIPDAFRQTVPPSTSHTLSLEDATGAYLVTGHLELWGLRDLPDPYETPLPATVEEAEAPPHSERIFDMDGDGNPGMTAQIQGFVSGDQYFVQRRVLGLDGITLGPDRLIGLVDNKSEKTSIGGSNRVLAAQNEVTPDPNPLLTWFDQLRIADEAGCEAVKALVADEALGFDRPF